jgi:hypothetical protein
MPGVWGNITGWFVRLLGSMLGVFVKRLVYIKLIKIAGLGGFNDFV